MATWMKFRVAEYPVGNGGHPILIDMDSLVTIENAFYGKVVVRLVNDSIYTLDYDFERFCGLLGVPVED